MPNPQLQTAPKSTGLIRQIGFVSATALVISNMVGTGIFATTGFMAGDLGNAKLILLAWFVGAVFALCGALSYSELGIHDRLGVVLRGFFRGHRTSGACLRGLCRLFLPRIQASQCAVHDRFGRARVAVRRRAVVGLGLDWRIHDPELFWRGTNG